MFQRSIAVAAPVLSSGTVFAEIFEIGRALHAPYRDAILYEVREQGTNKDAVLLLLDPGLLQAKSAQRQFIDEIVSSSALQGPHLIRLITGGIDPATNTPWLLFEPWAGESLESILEHRDFFNPREVLSILTQVGAALAAGHRVHRVHGDLKPRHIYLSPPAAGADQSEVKLFGLTLPRVLQELRSGQMNPSWMAPEQASRSRRSNPATDVFALGLLAFRLLVGRTYYAAANQARAGRLAVVREAMLEPLPAASQRARELGCPNELPPWFDRWFARCVVRDPAERFANAAMAVDALGKIVAEEEPAKVNPNNAARGPRRLPRPLYMGALAACAVAMLSVHRIERLPHGSAPAPRPTAVVENADNGPARPAPPAGPKVLGKEPAPAAAPKENKSAQPPRPRPRPLVAILRGLQERCASMSKTACVDLAWRYRDGRGVWRDPNLATYYFQRACELHDPLSCEQLPRAHPPSPPAAPPSPPPLPPPPPPYMGPPPPPRFERPPLPPLPSAPSKQPKGMRRPMNHPPSEPNAPTWEA